MRDILRHRGLKLIFLANMISMFGSGMNSAAVTWHILQAEHSEMYLAYLMLLQTIPATLLLPFSGVIIDRQDRRRIVMLLDGGRAAVILIVAWLALEHRVQLWQLYAMNVLVALGFWMFWPSVTALIQELTPESDFVHSNTLLMAGVQGGFLISGAVVGFLYNSIGLGGILLIDVSTYAVSFLLYLLVRKGRHVVAQPAVPQHLEVAGAWARYFHEMREGMDFLKTRPGVVLIGMSWSLFLGAMLTQNVTTAPLSDRILHSGAVGFGWLNGAWGVGAFCSALYAARMIGKNGGRTALAASLALLAIMLSMAPFTRWIALAAMTYFLMGSGRGLSGIALSTIMMQAVPKHFMGRVQNTFYFIGMLLQMTMGMLVGWVASHRSLTAAFALIASTYAMASLLTMHPLAAHAIRSGAARETEEPLFTV